MSSQRARAADPSGSEGRWPALDGLRGVCILIVLARHSGLPWVTVEGPAALYTRGLVRWGLFGMDGFFTLTGFLITGLLVAEHERTGSIALRRFYAGRAMRLLPALGLFLVATTTVLVWEGQRLEPLLLAVTAPTLLSVFNWVVLLEPWRFASVFHVPVLAMLRLHFFGHLWSLSVTQQFYLLWPLVLAWLLRRPAAWGRVPGLLAAGTVAATAWRMAVSVDFPRWAVLGSDTRAGPLLLGALLAVLRARRPALLGARARRVAVAAVASVGIVAVYQLVAGAPAQPFRSLQSGGLLAFGSAGAIVLVLDGSPPRPMVWLLDRRLLRWLGRISYGLYLWHVPILLLPVPGLGGTHPAVNVGIRLVLTCLVAALSFHGVEMPLMRWWRRARGRSAASRRLAESSAGGP